MNNEPYHFMCFEKSCDKCREWLTEMFEMEKRAEGLREALARYFGRRDAE